MRQVQGQAPGSNVPASPLWPIFSQLLSTQTGRSIQDINALGLSDPTINQLWTSYTATLSKMSQTPAPTLGTSTTPPPLPDLYQSSYSFSSNSNTNQGSSSSSSSSSRAAASSANTAKASSSAQKTLSYNDILSLINQLSSGASAAGGASSAPTKTTTTAQDVMSAYAQLSGSGSSANSNLAQGNTDYRALLQKYMAGAASAGTTGSSGSSSSSPSYQSLVDQYNSLVNQGGASSGASSISGSTSYEQLLQQYNQIMGKASETSPTANKGSSPSSMLEQYLALMSKPGSATGPTSDQLLQMYKLMSGGKTPSPDTTTTTPAPSPAASPQETFEKQLATFFPQFKSLFPQSSTSNSSTSSSSSGSASASTDPAASNAAQMIFDTLLFAPNKPAAAETASGTSSGAKPGAATEVSNSSTPAKPTNNSPLSYIQNIVNSRGGSEAIISNHVQNVFKTRASREMGCRFLPELLELDLLPTAPVNCMNKCPFPYVNPQQFGFFCLCCPPGVNEHTVGMMSLMRGNSYMETPLSVVS
ncbi:hypothetical protein BsWGS_02508 [Bradybaena similaris]